MLKITGIICEYNPLHLGHKKQMDLLRSNLGEDCTIVCLMSGNFVQRGAPAIVDKSLRAKAALLSGADLVLELPVTTALSSAEGFAAGGVTVLSKVCDTLCFGAESANNAALLQVARILLSEEFPPLLRAELDKGLSFPAARQAALAAMGADAELLSRPNNILAVEYCKAILAQGSPMDIFPIHREGSYHAETADEENPSATAVRKLMLQAYNWRTCVPKEVRNVFASAPLHTMAAGERAVLSRLRTMTDAEFEALPYGSEGLWRKFMHECRQKNTLEEILTAVKSKRYTRTRLDRMMMCAFLGLTAEDLRSPAPYARILGFTKRGQQVLHIAKEHTTLYNVGQRVDSPQWALEQRCNDLYGLFAENIEPAGMEPKRRVIII